MSGSNEKYLFFCTVLGVTDRMRSVVVQYLNPSMQMITILYYVMAFIVKKVKYSTAQEEMRKKIVPLKENCLVVEI